jgi:hypothetical protein
MEPFPRVPDGAPRSTSELLLILLRHPDQNPRLVHDVLVPLKVRLHRTNLGVLLLEGPLRWVAWGMDDDGCAELQGDVVSLRIRANAVTVMERPRFLDL